MAHYTWDYNFLMCGAGGGGAVQAKFTLAQNLDGGAGGSGSTGTSASSFVRIYKFW